MLTTKRRRQSDVPPFARDGSDSCRSLLVVLLLLLLPDSFRACSNAAESLQSLVAVAATRGGFRSLYTCRGSQRQRRTIPNQQTLKNCCSRRQRRRIAAAAAAATTTTAAACTTAATGGVGTRGNVLVECLAPPVPPRARVVDGDRRSNAIRTIVRMLNRLDATILLQSAHIFPRARSVVET